MITWGYASASDIEAFYGEHPAVTIRAVIIHLDGVPAGVIGLAFEGDRARAFSEYRPELASHLKSIPVLRAIKAAQGMYASSVKPVVAVREGCSGILERLGFESVDGELYLWRGSQQQHRT